MKFKVLHILNATPEKKSQNVPSLQSHFLKTLIISVTELLTQVLKFSYSNWNIAQQF